MRYAALIVLAVLAGCGGDDDDTAATPVDTMERAKAALLDGDAEAACALLTEHGRQQALAFREKDTCEANFRAEMNDIGGDAYRRDVRGATFKVTERSGDRATVRLMSGPYIEIDFTLVKTDDRWLIEDSEAVPYGD
jgi:hypothetical protein